jgi:cytosine/creatinine deaminase
MRLALTEAGIGKREGGIPIGSVLVVDDKVIGRGHNQRVQQDDPILHAEIDCLRNAGRIHSYRRATLYSTLMPCFLCAGAVVQFGIPSVVVGDDVNFGGAADFMRDHGVSVIVDRSPECISLMKKFICSHRNLWNEDIGRADAACSTHSESS